MSRDAFLERARQREISAGNLATTLAPAQLSADACGVGGFSGGYGYDAERDNASRSYLRFPLTARREITPRTRRVILEKLRSLEANLGIVPRMKGQVGKYAVGRGIFPVPLTKDTAWNESAILLFEDWANNRFVCDAAGAMTFWERQRYHAETFFSENESFDAMISSSFAGAPQLQLIDTSEVGSGYLMRAGFVDGVRVNGQNRPIEYELCTQFDPIGRPISQIVSASDMIHLVRRKRANQLRGVSAFAPVINTGIDMMDLDAVVSQSAKLHNAMGVTVNKKSGEAGKQGIAGKIKKQLDGDGKVTQVDEQFIRGAVIQYLGLDEEMKIVSSDRPTENLLAFQVYRIRQFCITTGLPFEIVWNLAELGGANSRIILADAQWFFDFIQDAINEMLNQRVWVWFCATMMKSGALMQCSDPRWWPCHWQGPPKLTADAGRTIKGDIDALGAGLNTWEDYYNQRGRGWKQAIGQRIAELAWAQAEAEKANVPFEYIYSLKPGVNVSVGSQAESGAGA